MVSCQLLYFSSCDKQIADEHALQLAPPIKLGQRWQEIVEGKGVL
jgi:hypothetical protein